MNENPPLPQPSGATCANCGAPQSTSIAYCTNCGAPLKAATAGALSSTSKTIISLALGFGALMFGAVGGCLVFLGGAGGGSWDPTLLILIGVPFLAALACIWGIFKVQSK